MLLHMSLRSLRLRSLRLRSLRTLRFSAALAALAALACCALTTPAALALSSARMTSVSANWAGYVVTPPAGASMRFSSVSGAWRVPTAACSPGQETDSAVWVGLGGYSEAARGLEQVGTDADCTRAGSPVYNAWFELLPAEPVNLKLAVHPGDAMVASVTLAHADVTLRIRNLTTGRRFSVTKHTANIDASSAEWIVEAPSLCVGSQACEVLPLTNFGLLAFSSATAVAHGRTGTIHDAKWSATALELQQRAFTHALGHVGARVLRTLTVASPSPSTGPLGAFTVSWTQQSVQLERPGPATLPGFGGGPP